MMVFEFLIGVFLGGVLSGIALSGLVWLIGWLITFTCGIFKSLGKE